MKRNTSQGSVATYARCGGITNGHFTAANLLENLPVKEFGKSVNILQNYGHEFRVQFFLAHVVYAQNCTYSFIKVWQLKLD